MGGTQGYSALQEIFSVFDPIVETNAAFAADAAVEASLFLPSARQV
jgi:hypothetical protein